MITTPSSLRDANQQVKMPQEIPAGLPPFALPSNTTNYQVITPDEAFPHINGSRAGFVGRNTAILVYNIL